MIWKVIRPQLSPGFTAGKMKSLFPQLMEVCQEMKSYLEHCVPSGTIDTKELCTKFSINAVASCAYGINGHTFEDPEAEFRKVGRKFLQPSFLKIVQQLFLLLAPRIASFTAFQQLRRLLIDSLTYFTALILGHKSEISISKSFKVLEYSSWQTFFVFIPRAGMAVEHLALEWLLRVASLEVTEFFRKMTADATSYRRKEMSRKNDFLELLIQLKEKHEEQNKLENNRWFEKFTEEDIAAQKVMAGFSVIVHRGIHRGPEGDGRFICNVTVTNKKLVCFRVHRGRHRGPEGDGRFLCNVTVTNKKLACFRVHRGGHRGPEEFTEEDIAAQALTFFTDGFETSSNALTMTLYEVAMNPGVQQRIRREVKDMLDRHGGGFTYEGLLELSYLEKVFAVTYQVSKPRADSARWCFGSRHAPLNSFDQHTLTASHYTTTSNAPRLVYRQAHGSQHMCMPQGEHFRSRQSEACEASCLTLSVRGLGSPLQCTPATPCTQSCAGKVGRGESVWQTRVEELKEQSSTGQVENGSLSMCKGRTRDSDYCNFTTVLEEEAPTTGNNDSPALPNLITFEGRLITENKRMTTLLLSSKHTVPSAMKPGPRRPRQVPESRISIHPAHSLFFISHHQEQQTNTLLFPSNPTIQERVIISLLPSVHSSQPTVGRITPTQSHLTPETKFSAPTDHYPEPLEFPTNHGPTSQASSLDWGEPNWDIAAILRQETTDLQPDCGESLRKHTPVMFLRRQCTKLFELKNGAGKVCRIEPKTSIIIPTYAIIITTRSTTKTRKYSTLRGLVRRTYKIVQNTPTYLLEKGQEFAWIKLFLRGTRRNKVSGGVEHSRHLSAKQEPVGWLGDWGSNPNGVY
uniref:Cytochrome P450 n=1 Tax=Timema shepardi TaxID=629360 RepID=A0A7R9G163_TIMSH|nr:unnamed protein product [Timema shepardi]